MRFDLEGAGPAVAHVDDAGVFAGPLDDAIAFGGQALEVHAAGFVGAVLAPHHAVDAEFGERRRAAERRENALVLLRGDAVWASNCGVMVTGSGTTAEEELVIVVAFIVAQGHLRWGRGLRQGPRQEKGAAQAIVFCGDTERSGMVAKRR